MRTARLFVAIVMCLAGALACGGETKPAVPPDDADFAEIIGGWFFEDLDGKLPTTLMTIGKDFFQEGKREPEIVVIEKRAGEFRIVLNPNFPDNVIVLKPDGRGGLDGRLEDRGEVSVRFRATRYTPTIFVGEVDPERIRNNENKTVAALKSYVNAQIRFKDAGMGRVASNTGAGVQGYADNFRNLHYGKPVAPAQSGETAELIDQDFADAFLAPTRGAPVPAGAAQSGVPYNGYFFLEAPGVDFSKTFGLVAYPTRFNQTGGRVFYVGEDGVIYEMNLDGRKGGIPGDGDTPAPISERERPDRNPDLWTVQ